MLHETHPGIPRPALLVVVPHDVFVVRVGVLRQEALDEVPGLVLAKPEEHMDLIHVALIKPDRVPGLHLALAEGEELVRHVRRPSNLRRPGQTQKEQVQNEPVILGQERSKLQAPNDTVRVGMGHILEGDDNVVLGRHVVSDVVIDDQPQQPVEKREVDLLVYLLEVRLHHDYALAVGRVPNILQIVDALAPLVDEQRRRLRVCRLHPVGEEVPLVGLVPEVLIQVGVSYLLQRLDFIHGHKVRVHVEEGDRNLLERPLGEQVPLDSGQGLVRVVVRLFHKPEFLSLHLAELHCRGVELFQALQCQDEDLRVVLVRQRREWNRGKLPALQPVNGRGVDGNGFLGAHIGSVFQVVVLPLLLRLQIQPGQAAQVLPGNRLVDRRTPPDSLPVVMGHVGPPVGLHLDVAQDHRLDWRREPRHLPGNVGLPAAPGLAEVLEDCLGLVLLDALRHHVEDVVHHRSTQLEIKV
mmetsp:Transcript_2955/g.8791  ORF Transcript_2955/g.8791 Transcript_2955/m.8791 type:complete len:467 (+) Transcript_2955:3703-5103(+)